MIETSEDITNNSDFSVTVECDTFRGVVRSKLTGSIEGKAVGLTRILMTCAPLEEGEISELTSGFSIHPWEKCELVEGLINNGAIPVKV